MASSACWYVVTSIQGVGPARVRKLLDAFGSLDEALAAEAPDVLATGALTEAQYAALRKRLDRVEEIEAFLEDLSMDGVSVVTPDHDGYPNLLRNLRGAPVLLYVAGDPDALSADGAAVVGPRAASDEALEYARALGASLSEAGLAVYSGLAAGIDTQAHVGAVEVEGVPVGILGSGLGAMRVEDPDLVGDVRRLGALATEYAMTTPPSVARLMARNRVVVGLSRAVIVVDVGETGGTRDTAERALKGGRPLFLGAPGLTHSAGRALEAMGARPLGDPEDVAEVAEAVRAFVDPSPQPDEPDPPGQLTLDL